MATPFTTVQFEDFYDVYKMRALVDDLERQFATLQVDVTSGGGGVTVHNDLPGRSASDTHPISSITGLVRKQTRPRSMQLTSGLRRTKPNSHATASKGIS